MAHVTVDIESHSDWVVAHALEHKKTAGPGDTITWRNKTGVEVTIWFPWAAEVFTEVRGDVVAVLDGTRESHSLTVRNDRERQTGYRPYSIACRFPGGDKESVIVMAVGGSSPWVIIK